MLMALEKKAPCYIETSLPVVVSRLVHLQKHSNDDD